MNKKISYPVVGALLVLVLISFFGGDKDIKNASSLGVDLIAFGDSLIVGDGASTDNDFISLLSKKIGKPIINLGVSGNTTQDGLARIEDLDKYNPKVVILLLGGNDYLNKVSINETFSNLEKIIKNIQSRGAIVLLLGIRGGLFNDKFDSRFEELSEKYNTAFVPNVLDGLFANNKYMSDTIHPNDAGYEIIESRVYPVLSNLLK
ncbi:MAG: arylesterase [Candidatus Zambryskibacteria bacterium]|nr:arylesterase [Candidatus Zambryskibacteria bacterium]